MSNEIKNILKKSSEYDNFITLDENRMIKNSHRLKLEKSLLKKDLLKDFPIIVTWSNIIKKYIILDGQHRFYAAIELNIPIWYKEAIDMNENDIQLINCISLKWNSEDFFHHFISRGNQNYIKLKKFIDDSKLPSLNIALTVLGFSNNIKRIGEFTEHKLKQIQNKQYGEDGIRYSMNMFKEGKYIHPEKEDAAWEFCNTLNYIGNYYKDFYLTRSFIGAFLICYKHSKFDKERMIRKVEKDSYIIQPCPQIKDYLKLFQELYNYREKEENRIFFIKR